MKKKYARTILSFGYVAICGLCLLHTPQVALASITDNLVSYWKLDESSGNASDSVGSKTLTNINTVTYSAGKINNGANFVTASSQYFTFTPIGLSGTTFSISGWFNLGTNQNGVIYQEGISGSGNPYVEIARGGATGADWVLVARNSSAVGLADQWTADVTRNVWHHFVWTMTTTQSNLYLDGNTTPIRTTNFTANSFTPDVGRIGDEKRTSEGGYFGGSLDEIGVWTRVLSSSEITTLYNSGNGSQYPFGTTPTSTPPTSTSTGTVVADFSNDTGFNANSGCSAITTTGNKSTAGLYNTNSPGENIIGILYSPLTEVTFDEIKLKLEGNSSGRNYSLLVYQVNDATSTRNFNVDTYYNTTILGLPLSSTTATMASTTFTSFTLTTPVKAEVGKTYLFVLRINGVDLNPLADDTYYYYNSYSGSDSCVVNYFNQNIHIFSIPSNGSGGNNWTFSPFTGSATAFYLSKYYSKAYLPFQLLSNGTAYVQGCKDPTASNYNPLANAGGVLCEYKFTPSFSSFTFASSTQLVTITGNIPNNYSTVGLYFTSKGNQNSAYDYTVNYSLTPGSFTKTFTIPMPATTSINSFYTLKAELLNATGTPSLLGVQYVYYDSRTIVLNSGAFGYSTSTTPMVLNMPDEECNVLNISGCFKNAVKWAFVPDQDAINSYYNFVTVVQTKAPVGYYTVVRNNLGNLNSSSTKAFNITIPKQLKNTIFDPIDVGIASILWFFFIIHFYKRLKTITV